VFHVALKTSLRVCLSTTSVVNLFPLDSVDPKEIKEFVETTITINKETAGLGLGIVGGSETYLVRKCSRAFTEFYCINLWLQRRMVVRQCTNNINLSKMDEI